MNQKYHHPAKLMGEDEQTLNKLADEGEITAAELFGARMRKLGGLRDNVSRQHQQWKAQEAAKAKTQQS